MSTFAYSIKCNLALTVSLLLLSGFFIDASAQPVTINEAGRIVYETPQLQQTDGEVTYQLAPDNHKVLIKSTGPFTMRGNGFLKLDSGYLAMETFEEAKPTTLRFYDQHGNLSLERSYPATVQLQLSPDHRAVGFFDGRNLIHLNLETGREQSYPGTRFFALRDNAPPVFALPEELTLHIDDSTIPLPALPRALEVRNNDVYVFTRHSLYRIADNGLDEILNLPGTYFDHHFEAQGNLFLSVRNSTEYQTTHELIQVSENGTTGLLQQVQNSRPDGEYFESIRCPLNFHESEYAITIGNTYGQIQQYGNHNSAYLHPGIDILGNPGTPVYAVRDGVVKAVLTISNGGENDIYWRVAIANEDTNEESAGYLYAHLRLSTITVTEGDSVKAGEKIGELISWPAYNFTHIHFARIKDEGAVWNGFWWTMKNVLRDLDGAVDDHLPVFETVHAGNPFLFMSETGSVLPTDNVRGDVKIISKVYDRINSHWQVDVDSLRYRIIPAENPDTPVKERTAIVFDFSLDTYFSSSYDWSVLTSVYSREEPYYSIGNYQSRAFYHILTNNSVNGNFGEAPSASYFDTTELEDGDYILEVTAINAMGGKTTESMSFTITNHTETDTGPGEEKPEQVSLTQNYPNPFNSGTVIEYSVTNTGPVTIHLYNVSGQRVDTIVDTVLPPGTYEVQYDAAHLATGIYFYTLRAGSQQITRSMMLVK